eukprot:6206704-Pleurochrysis_carterae.AAC.7
MAQQGLGGDRVEETIILTAQGEQTASNIEANGHPHRVAQSRLTAAPDTQLEGHVPAYTPFHPVSSMAESPLSPALMTPAPSQRLVFASSCQRPSSGYTPFDDPTSANKPLARGGTGGGAYGVRREMWRGVRVWRQARQDARQQVL